MRSTEHLSFASFPEPEMVRHHVLAHDIIRVQPDVARLRVPDDSLLRRWQLTKFGDPQLNDEEATGSQMTRLIAEAIHLLRLRQQIRDGVEYQVDQGVLSGGNGC